MFFGNFSPIVQFNKTQDLYKEVYAQYTNLSLTVVATDGGIPTRGTYATMTIEVHNTCLVDEEFLNIIYDVVIGYRTGTANLVVPGYFQYPMRK